MSKKNQCYLCGGKLTRGYCAACGLDNTRLERKHYHLNESNAARRLESNGNKNTEIPKPKKEKKSIKPISAAGTSGISGTLKTSGATGYSYAGQGNYAGSNTGFTGSKRQKNSSSKVIKNGKKSSVYSGMRVKIIAPLLAAVVAIGSFLVEFIEEKRNEPVTTFFDSSDDNDFYDPYEYVERGLSESGEFFETELEPGEYLVGVHLPEGNYTVELLDGSGYLDVEDYDNSIYLWENFGYDEEYDEVTGVTDVRLYSGAKVSIDDDVKLKFTTENGQTEEMEFIPNPLSIGYTLTKDAPMTAGEDFEAGVYDVQVLSEWAVLSYDIPTDAEYVENGVYERSLWLDADGRDGIYRNLVLPEGTVISTEEEEEILLTPSENIGTIDYSEYYDIY